ncbi:MAG TPA: AraC family transcriptional regulator [Allosphingosinicella sp.]|nr:AraC family transcriptional regulator [Allosphingosinicella sp.]
MDESAAVAGTISNGESVAAAIVRTLMDFAVAKGADRDALVRRSGLDPAWLDDPDGRIPYAHYKALMRAGKSLSGDPALALHFGEAFDMVDLSILGALGVACETVADAFALLGRFTRLVIDVALQEGADGQRMMLKRVGGALWLVDMRRDPSEFPELTESSFARMAAASRRFGGYAFIKAVHVTHEAPAYRDEYDRIFGVPVTFASDRNALLMTDDSWMNLKSPQPSRYALEVLRERAEALLEDLDSAKTMRGRVEKLLVPVLHTGEAGMAAVAAKLGMSRPTLFRKLKAEGVTFEAVRDALRRRLAQDCLETRRLSVGETAYLLGFSEPAAFSRAFRRWTGRSPRAARASAEPR